MGKVRVFLVDDHPLVREGIRRLLEKDQRVQVVGEAGSAEDAISSVKLTSPKVVLMDVRLPGDDGIEATRQLTANDPDLKVVIVSSFGDYYLAQAIEAGACGYILKTATQEELVGGVIQAAEGKSPIDPSLSRALFTRFATMARTTQTGGLSNRQREILQMVANGSSSKVMQAELFISEATLKREFRNIFNLLGVSDRAQAVAEAYRKNLIQDQKP